MTTAHIMELEAVKSTLVKKLSLVMLLASASILSSQSQAALISNFNTGVDVEVSSSISQSEFGTDLFDELVFIDGDASGSNSGSNYTDLVFLGANEIGRMSAAAAGQVQGIGGFVQSSWETEGYFYFENNTGSDINVDVNFDISWFANIFTLSNNEEAYATAGVFIEDSDGDTVFADWIELDSLLEGPGAFDVSDSFAVNFSFILADGDFAEYFWIADSFGFAESLPQVPEPTGILSAGLLLMLAIRGRKRVS